MSNEEFYAAGLLNRALDPATQPLEIQSYLQAELDLLDEIVTAGMRVIDVGCGTGRHLHRLGDRLQLGVGWITKGATSPRRTVGPAPLRTSSSPTRRRSPSGSTSTPPTTIPSPTGGSITSMRSGWCTSGSGGERRWTSLDSAPLEEAVEFPWADQIARRWGKVGPVTRAESVLQVTHHTAHRRGQVLARLRELGGEPPLIHFVAWLWQGGPAPVWPAHARS